MKRIALLATFIGITIALSSCRTSVPEPSRAVHNNSTAHSKFKMFNTAPQRASNAQSVHFVDLDQDGHLDLLVGGNARNEGFHIEWGNSSGNWSIQSGPPTTMQPLSFSTGDVNHTGTIDILIGGRGDQKGLQVWELNLESNTWDMISSPIETGIYKAVQLIDINQDGWLDIVAAKSGSTEDGGVIIFLNNGQGGWQSATNPSSSGVFTGLSVADINHDGYPDIVASRRGGLGSKQGKERLWSNVGGIQIWYGDGNGRWQPEVLPANGDVESMTIADINGDGEVDIIAGLYQQGITMWLNEDDGWDENKVIEQGTWSSLRVGDLDADGKRELVASSPTGQGLKVWSWKGGSFYSEDNLVPTFGAYLDIDLGDTFNNGTLSIAAANADSGIEVWSSAKANPAPLKSFVGKKIGRRLSIYFESASAALTPESQASLKSWVKSLSDDVSKLELGIQGHADKRPIHTELFPNNIALSKARAESVASWLVNQGAKAENIIIIALGDKSPLLDGLDPASLKQNRVSYVEAYKVEKVNLPTSASNLGKRNLYEVSENKVFKTIDGIPEYKVGVGDELSITFWQGGKSETKKVIVQIDGTVSLPYQSALKVAGYTPREIDRLTTEILKKYERNPRVDVLVLKAQSKHLSIFGEVQNLTRQPTGPGIYSLKGRESLVDFLSRAGGPTHQANLNSVQIIRNGKTIILNLNRAIRQGDSSENAIVDDGDTIFIPSLAQSKRQIYVLGQVNKTGIVEFTDDINFLDAISKSGGLTPDAYLPDIRVLRANRDKPEIIPINFQRFLEQGDLTQNLTLMDKDIVIIPARPIANWNKFIADISPTITLLLQPVSIAQQILTLQALSGQLQ